jgi:transcriptional regulator with XRE-family HTH domain
MSELTPGEILVRIRNEADLTQAEMASATGVSGAMISHIESGRRNIGLATIEKIADGLELSGAEVDELRQARRDFTPSDPGRRESVEARVTRLENELSQINERLRLLTGLLEQR